MHSCRLRRKWIIERATLAKPGPQLVSLRGRPAEGQFILRLVAQPVAVPTSEVPPAVQDATAAPAAETHEPAPLASVVGVGEGERHDFGDPGPRVIASTAGAIVQSHARGLNPVGDCCERVAAARPDDPA